MDRSDYVRIIDAAHDHAAPDDVWLRGLLAALRPVLDRGLGVFGWFHAPHEHPAAAAERLGSQSGQPDGAALRAAISVGPVTTLRATLGAEALGHVLGAAAKEHKITDALGLYGVDSDGHGVGIAACSSEVVELSRQARQDLERVVVHLTAAFRLRRRRGAAEAVVLDLHRALVAGRWSLVDTFERDGKRYLIARRNAPAPVSAPELSVRETQVAVFAAMGHALKRIAYELGVSESSVATYLRRALVKLRLPDRNALTRRFAGFQHSRIAGATQVDPAGGAAR